MFGFISEVILRLSVKGLFLFGFMVSFAVIRLIVVDVFGWVPKFLGRVITWIEETFMKRN